MHRRHFLASLGAVSAGCIAGRNGGKREPRGPQFWLARRGEARVFVLGGADARDRSWLTEPIQRAFGESSELWLEVPPGPPPEDVALNRRIGEVKKELGHRPGRTFFDALTPSVRERARTYVTELGIDLSTIEPMRPWLAYFTLNAAFWRKHTPPLPVEYADQVMRERAARDGKPIRYEFPTTEAVLRWFAALSDEAQSQHIEMLLDFLDDQKKGLNEVYFGWVTGNPSTRAIDRMRTKTPALYDAIQVRRNIWWARHIGQLLATGGTYFALVGLNHALGPDGIPRQLERLGIAPPVLVDS